MVDAHAERRKPLRARDAVADAGGAADVAAGGHLAAADDLLVIVAAVVAGQDIVGIAGAGLQKQPGPGVFARRVADDRATVTARQTVIDVRTNAVAAQDRSVAADYTVGLISYGRVL